MALLIRLIVTVVAGALAVLFLLKKGQPGETISATNRKGSITVKADDGSAGGPNEHVTQPVAIPQAGVDDEKTKGSSKAKGHIAEWNALTGEAIAILAAGPPAPPNPAMASSVSTATMSFTLKKNGKVVTPTIANNFTAELNDDVKATIKLTASVAPAGGAAVASVSKTYNLAPDPTKPGQIKITGDQTDTMMNGKKKSYTETGNAATLNAGKYDCTFALTIEASGKGTAKVIFDKCDLTLS